MSFLEHLEELRWHLIRGLLGILIGMVILLIFVQDLIQYVILAPLKASFPTLLLLCKISPQNCLEDIPLKLQAISPSEQFTKAIVVGLVGGLILTFPYLVWEIWRFIKPGLYPSEVKKLKGIVGIISFLFLLGIAFTYLVVLPFTFRFFVTFQLAPDIENIWRIGDIISMVVQFSLAGGVLFQLPVLVYALSRIGILSPSLMRKFRKQSYVSILIIAGLLTPSPDVFSQLLLAIPMGLLYEGSILISAKVEKQRQKEWEDFLEPNA